MNKDQNIVQNVTKCLFFNKKNNKIENLYQQQGI